MQPDVHHVATIAAESTCKQGTVADMKVGEAAARQVCSDADSPRTGDEANTLHVRRLSVKARSAHSHRWCTTTWWGSTHCFSRCTAGKESMSIRAKCYRKDGNGVWRQDGGIHHLGANGAKVSWDADDNVVFSREFSDKEGNVFCRNARVEFEIVNENNAWNSCNIDVLDMEVSWTVRPIYKITHEVSSKLGTNKLYTVYSDEIDEKSRHGMMYPTKSDPTGVNAGTAVTCPAEPDASSDPRCVPEFLHGLWWMRGNPASDEVASFVSSEWKRCAKADGSDCVPVGKSWPTAGDAKKGTPYGTAIIKVYGTGRWSWHYDVLGRTVYKGAHASCLTYRFYFEKDNAAVIARSLKGPRAMRSAGVNFATIVPEADTSLTDEVAIPASVLTFTMDKIDKDHWVRRSTVQIPQSDSSLLTRACDALGMGFCGSEVAGIQLTHHIYDLRRIVDEEGRRITTTFKDPALFPEGMIAGALSTPPSGGCTDARKNGVVSEWQCYVQTVTRTSLLANTDEHHPCGSAIGSYVFGAAQRAPAAAGGSGGVRPAVAALIGALSALCGGAVVAAAVALRKRADAGAMSHMPEAEMPLPSTIPMMYTKAGEHDEVDV